jgi:hypothetical protein
MDGRVMKTPKKVHPADHVVVGKDGKERKLTMLEKIRGGFARVKDLYRIPKMFGLKGMEVFYTQTRDHRLYRVTTAATGGGMTWRRVSPPKVKGKANVKRYKRARRMAREAVAYLKTREAVQS